MIVADELDYLITKDGVVLDDLFMLVTFPFSRCILIEFTVRIVSMFGRVHRLHWCPNKNYYDS
ncbi:unnamed protein product [Trifolium pratense]|uniref:Uncharacterized protein n=1 Tax=Trifolium pratense TaxID=57577 RepID=A0ACB0K1Z1_TRIPR|nr:unnamed protein product [Trifolium pratense]